jgi:hypothetical protein
LIVTQSERITLYHVVAAIKQVYRRMIMGGFGRTLLASFGVTGFESFGLGAFFALFFVRFIFP